MTKKEEEEALIQRCLRHERAAQEELYRRYADAMYNVSLMYTANEDDACDVLQDGFIKVFRRLNSFQFESSLKHWIRRIIVNTALDLYRKKKRKRENEETYSQQVHETTVNNIIEKIHVRDIVNMVQQLPTRAGMILKLYAVEGYSHREISEMLNISEGTSKSQLNRARTLLKALIKKQNG